MTDEIDLERLTEWGRARERRRAEAEEQARVAAEGEES